MADKQPRRPMSDLAFSVGTIVGTPVIIVGAWLVLGEELPPEGLAVMLGVYAMGLVWAVLALTLRTEATTAPTGAHAVTDKAAAALALDAPELALLWTLPAPGIGRVIRVVGAVGVCPRGLAVGHSVNVDAEGRLSAPLCRTAAQALAPVIMKLAEEGIGEGQARCQCPVGDRSLTFALRRRGAMNVNQGLLA